MSTVRQYTGVKSFFEKKTFIFQELEREIFLMYLELPGYNVEEKSVKFFASSKLISIRSPP